MNRLEPPAVNPHPQTLRQLLPILTAIGKGAAWEVEVPVGHQKMWFEPVPDASPISFIITLQRIRLRRNKKKAKQ